MSPGRPLQRSDVDRCHITKQDLGVMFFSRFSWHMNHPNRILSNRFTLEIIIITVLTSPVRLSEVSPNNCETFTSCGPCTSASTCVWSVRNQTCNATSRADTIENPRTACPKFTVHNAGPEGFTVTVVEDATAELAGILRDSDVKCLLEKIVYAASTDGNTIVCTNRTKSSDTKNLYDVEFRSTVYLSVTFNGTLLRFDRPQDHYVTIYPDGGMAKDCANVSCSNCWWDEKADQGRLRYYCTWCSADEPCAGNVAYQYCDVRKYPKFSLILEPDLKTVRKKKYVRLPGRECPVAQIDRFEPTRGLRAGGAMMRITVPHHDTLFELKPHMTVKVAGRGCSNISAINDTNTLLCTVNGPNPAKNVTEGPVEVTYFMADAVTSSMNLILRSAGNFTFVDPQITSVQPTAGPITGGTLLTIAGHFDVANGTRLRAYVGNDGPECAVIGSKPELLQCLTGDASSSSVVSGPVKIVFDGFSGRQIVYGPQFEYVAVKIDVNQTFSGIASGGTTLWVRGRRFSSVTNATVHVTDDRDGKRRYEQCRIWNDTHAECRSPALDASPSVRDLPFGLLVSFASTGTASSAASDSEALYRLYPDPVVADYEVTDEREVTVNGVSLARGYTADDVTVRLCDDDAGPVKCPVASIDSDRIVCHLPSSLPSSPLRHNVIVMIGHFLKNVPRNLTCDNNPTVLKRQNCTGIDVKDSAVAITNFTPSFALSFDKINITIFVKNYSILSKNRTVTITVAGHNCVNPNIIHDNMVSCIVSKEKIYDTTVGPVEVMYSSSTNYTIKSQKSFTFFRPTVVSFEPKCGSVNGGTGLKVVGTFLNVTRNVNVMIGNIDCEIQEFSHDHIKCLTGISDKPQVTVPKILFDKKLVQKFKSNFTYVNNPTVDKRQNLTGIVSGGTKMQILGNFACVKGLKINVNYEGSEIFENCELANERKIVCVTPKLERKPDTILPMLVPFRLLMNFEGRTMKTPETHYQLYPDPIFLNFDVNGTTIKINGMYLNMGYRPDDLFIQIQNFTHTCNVLFADQGYIVCQVPSTLSVDLVQGLIITVGQSLKTVIGKKFNPMSSRQFQMATVLSGISIISVFVALVFGLLFCYKIILTNSKQQTEKRYMEELRNITAGMEDKKF